MTINIEHPVIEAQIVMDDLSDLQEIFDDWRQEINAQLITDTVRNVTFLPDHELRLEVTAPFVPTELKGVLLLTGADPISWVATLDLDASHTRAAAMRKNICVYSVVQDD